MHPFIYLLHFTSLPPVPGRHSVSVNVLINLLRILSQRIHILNQIILLWTLNILQFCQLYFYEAEKRKESQKRNKKNKNVKIWLTSLEIKNDNKIKCFCLFYLKKKKEIRTVRQWVYLNLSRPCCWHGYIRMVVPFFSLLEIIVFSFVKGNNNVPLATHTRFSRFIVKIKWE